ncbi:MAG: FxsA family protein [Hyphomicrobiales bacterium]
MIRYFPLILVAGLLAEITSLVVVGGWIGILPVLLLIVGAVVAGVALIRTGGISVATAVRQPPRPDTAQSNQALSGVFRVFSGLLLIVPGFVSDAAGLYLLLPPVQRWIGGFFHNVFSVHHRPAGLIIDAEAVEIRGENVDTPGPEDKRERLEG